MATPLVDVDGLRTLLAISECGTMRRAADAIGRTPSAISMQIQRMEARLERPLLDRSARGVSLTGDGEQLLDYAKKMVALAEEASARFRPSATAGVVKVGLPDDLDPGIVGRLVAACARRLPGVELEFLVCSPSLLAEALNRREIDVAIATTGGGPLPKGVDVLRTEPLEWVGLASFAWSAGDPLPLAVAQPGCQWREAAVSRLEAAGIEPRIVCTCSHLSAQIAAVQSGMAVSPLPLSIVPAALGGVGNALGLPGLPKAQFGLMARARSSAVVKAVTAELRRAVIA